CDTFAAITSDRPYRRAMTLEAALDELRRCAGTQFDPEVVRVFCEQIAAEPFPRHSTRRCASAGPSGAGSAA
ncbi:MAG TPA: HD domain-containing phosphohydrolase, partial [Gaiellaceae bacterium]|nr:HD domain-containing phosphohydrolase [Gaiellaceae bacterium]